MDLPTVCCMCGDVGFPDKLVRCNKCQHRYQHSYCSNYNSHQESSAAGVCDWCQSEERSLRQGRQLRRPAGREEKAVNRSEYSCDKIKCNSKEETSDRAKSSVNTPTSSIPSPKPAGRRYKLLKDVMH